MGRKTDRKKARAAEARAEEKRKALGWTIQRLNVLEIIILFFALILALVGGILVAWILAASFSFPFRTTWAIASLLLFIVPGGSVYLRELHRARKSQKPGTFTEPKDPNG